MTKQHSASSGFTLVEVLVSITLLLLVIIGPMQILTRANHSTAFATEQMTAWFLAQEGLELAQQARDMYMLRYFDNQTTNPNPWASFTTGPAYAACFTADGCDIYLGPAGAGADVDSCADLADCELWFNSSAQRHWYSHDHTTGAVTAPAFTRVIKMQETGSREILVTSTVMWRTGSLIAGQQVETTTYLFNIYDTP